MKIKKLPDGRFILKQRFGKKILRFRQGNYSYRRVVPRVEHGPFGCWLASWRWGQLEWALTRWE